MQSSEGIIQLSIYSSGLFTPDSQAYFNDSPAYYTEFYSTSELYVEVDASLYAPGIYDVHVVSSGSTSETDSFEFTPGPSVSSSVSSSASASPSPPPEGFAITIDPTFDNANGPTVVVMIYSDGLFAGDSQAYFDNTQVFTDIIDSSTLYTEIPGSDVGLYPIHVVSSGSTSETEYFEFV